MSIQPMGYKHQMLYKADANTTETVKSIRNRLEHVCMHHLNQYVKIETLDGYVVVGRIVGCDHGLLYVVVSNPSGQRGFGNPYSSDEMILTLVLYELLVITLLYT